MMRMLWDICGDRKPRTRGLITALTRGCLECQQGKELRAEMARESREQREVAQRKVQNRVLELQSLGSKAGTTLTQAV